MLSKLLIAWCLMAVCVVIHAMGLIAAFRWMKARTAEIEGRFWIATWMLIRAAGWMLLLHLLQITSWAFVYAWRGAMPDLTSAFYFSMVTYTTTGYGDLVLPEEWRILGGVEALTGILMCGLSTGMFFATFSKTFRLHSARVLLGTIASGWLATALCAAEPAGVSADKREITQELKEIKDPTASLRTGETDTDCPDCHR